MALSAQRGHPIRLVDGQRVGAHLGVEESWRHDVDSGKLSPFTG